jgi:type IV secretory pathway VirJ component
MKKCWYLLFMGIILLSPKSLGAAEETLQFEPFGKIVLYHHLQTPSHVVLFISGDGGWNLGVIDMARELSNLDALVVGVDIVHYLKHLAVSTESCSYPAADFELLSKFVQKKLGFPEYITPVLVGYSSGATLAYATLVQSPTGTFKAAMSMGFCPELPLVKPLCKGSGLECLRGPKGKGCRFLPAPKLQTPWIAFQGTIDQVCDAKTVEAYVQQVGNARLVLLPKVGHGFSYPKNWMPQFKAAFARLFQAPQGPLPAQPQDVIDLPLVEVPAQTKEGNQMAVMVSGDGGWAGLDREIAGALAQKGIPVVGWSSLRYFWNRRTPDSASRDLERLLRHYFSAWQKSTVLLIGYSLGADVLPFMADRLPSDLLKRVDLIVLLGLAPKVDFEFHFTNWWGGSQSQSALPVLPEVDRLKESKILCLYGEDEKNSLCPQLLHTNVKIIPLKDGHHMGGDYQKIANLILQEAR